MGPADGRLLPGPSTVPLSYGGPILRAARDRRHPHLTDCHVQFAIRYLRARAQGEMIERSSERTPWAPPIPRTALFSIRIPSAPSRREPSGESIGCRATFYRAILNAKLNACRWKNCRSSNPDFSWVNDPLARFARAIRNPVKSRRRRDAFTNERRFLVSLKKEERSEEALIAYHRAD